MSSEEGSQKQGGDDVNQELSQPKIISNDVIIETIAESSKQDKDDSTNPVSSETKLTNKVVEPMSRGNDRDETPTAAAKVKKGPGEEVKTIVESMSRGNDNDETPTEEEAKTGTEGAGKFSKNFTTENLSKECCCCGVMVCAACFDCLMRIPCLNGDHVVGVLSRARPILRSDLMTSQSMFNV
ncbi:hypothetical protein POM88_031671 [Heracleum sosnowskyi]|uniref:Uncharacterized protein n=1 Tax=Heracleum sosnowskyi TaxID=360622 RepID=A0AAD8HZZ2_9APIA|nr:hypothetical protein POM88_031671 [Heracleum sosnowskyi]